MSNPLLVGRSSSHYTRTVRIFAIELGVAHGFRPVLDILSPDPATFSGNPALKVPVLVDDEGPLFGTENICRAIAVRSGARDRVVLRGDVGDRVVANAEELVLHVMATEVTIILGKAGGDARLSPPKVTKSLEGALAWLDENVDAALAKLPAGRALSFLEASLFCTVKHLPFREVTKVDGYPRLSAFTARFGERESARATEYRFDAA